MWKYVAALLLWVSVLGAQMYPFPGPKNASSSAGLTISTDWCGVKASGTFTCNWTSSSGSPVTVPSGETVLCWIVNVSLTAPGFSVTDSASETYTNDGAVQTGDGTTSQQFFRLASTSTGITSMTFTVTALSVFPAAGCIHYRGGTGAFDSSVGYNSNAAGGSSLGVTITTSNASDVFYCAGLANAGAPTVTPDVTFTQLNASSAFGTNIAIAFKSLSTSGSQSTTWNYSGVVGVDITLMCGGWK